MTVSDPSVIDIVATHVDRQTLLLVMVEHRDWGNHGALLPDLQAKFNTYLAYALDGQLSRDYPEAAGKAIRIQLRCMSAPGIREQEFFEIARKQYLEPEGLGLDVLVESGT